MRPGEVPAAIYDRAAAVRSTLAAIPPQASVLAQPQLVPHIAKRVKMGALGAQQLGQPVIVESRAGAPIASIRGPLFSATMCSTLGGLSPRVAIAFSTNSSSSVKLRAALWRRSKPIVEEVFRSRPELTYSR